MQAVEVEVKHFDEEGEVESGVWLHYVGTRLYDLNAFIKESERYGVQRAIPLTFLKKLKWHERIFLARYVTTDEGKKALVFGYFTVDRISYTGSDEFRNLVKSKLNVVSESFGGGSVERVCGSYSVGYVTFVNNTVEEIYNAIRETMKETGEKVKVFIGGNLYLIEPIYVEAPFTRALVKVELDESKIKLVENKEALKKLRALEQLIDYRQRRYLSKKEREALRMKKLFEEVSV